MADEQDVLLGQRALAVENLRRADETLRLPVVGRPKSLPLEPPLTPQVGEQTRAVGLRAQRPDARNHGLGLTRYIDDIALPGMLYAKIKRAGIASARIKRIDTSAAEAMPGVAAVLIGREIPVNSFGPTFQDQPVLADDIVRHAGDGVAAVAAVTEQIAQAAIEKIVVEYEPLPAVFDPLEALREDSHKVHGSVSNIYVSKVIRKGDVEKGFAQSYKIFEGRYTTPPVEHAPMEPHTSIADWDANGRLTVYATIGRITMARTDLARTLKMQISRIRVVGTIVGGNFGGKNEIRHEPVLALLAKKAGRPVKGRFTRVDEFVSSTIRHAFVMDYKTGVSKDGSILARAIRLVADGGAYCSFSETTVGKACILAAGPYKIDNVYTEGCAVYTNKNPTGSMRGFGAPQVCFAYETQMDEIARELGIDPLELRLRNAYKEGSFSATGQLLQDVKVKESLDNAGRIFGWEGAVEKRRGRGRGIACMWYPVGFTVTANPSGAVVKVNEDGTAVVLTGTVETGQGSLGVLSQIAAEALGIAPNDIHIVSGDTDACPMDTGAIASRTTYITGNAIRIAAEKAREILFQVAAPVLGVEPWQLEAKDHKIQVKGFPQRNAPIGEIALRAQHATGTPAIGSASWNPPTVPLDPETGQGKPFGTYVYATQIAEVDVDEETGEVEVLRITASHDCGTPINPMLVEGQIEGGISMGLGFALQEEILFDKSGRQINSNLTNYIMPTALDMPKIDCDIVDSYDPTGPFGAKAVGEPSLVPTAVAITNAIYDAVGVRITSLPATSERVLAGIKAKRGESRKQIPA